MHFNKAIKFIQIWVSLGPELDGKKCFAKLYYISCGLQPLFCVQTLEVLQNNVLKLIVFKK